MRPLFNDSGAILMFCLSAPEVDNLFPPSESSRDVKTRLETKYIAFHGKELPQTLRRLKLKFKLNLINLLILNEIRNSKNLRYSI